MSFIVVGIDGSASSHRALSAAVAQAAHSNAQVRAINVVSVPAMRGYESGPIDITAMKMAAEATIGDAIDQALSASASEVPVEIVATVTTGHVGAELVRAATEDGGAAMVVAGSRGYGALKSALLGSVSTYLTHHLSCPLLLIPDPDRTWA